MADLDVRVLITGAADQLRRELSKSSDSVNDFGKRLSSSLNSASQRLTSLGKTMSLTVTGPLAALGGGLVALAVKTASVGDEIAKSAKSIGLSTDALQEYRFAIGQATDVTEGELNRALQNLNVNMGDLAIGGASDDLVAAFERVGISAADITSGAVNVDQALSDVISALQQTGSASEAAALGAELLGSRVGRSLGPQLRLAGGDIAGLRQQAQDMGIVLSGSVLEAAEAFSDQGDIMKRQFEAAGMAIGGAFLPVLVDDLMPFVIETALPGLVKMGDAVAGLIDWFKALPAPVKFATGVVAAALGASGPVLLALGVMARAFAAIVAVGSPLGAFIALSTVAVIAWQTWSKEITAIITDTLAWIGNTFSTFRDWWGALWEGFVEVFRDIFGEGIVGIIGDTTTAVTGGIVGAFEGVAATVGPVVSDLWGDIQERWGLGSQAIMAMNEAVAGSTAAAFVGGGGEAGAGVGGAPMPSPPKPDAGPGAAVLKAVDSMWTAITERWASGVGTLTALSQRLNSSTTQQFTNMASGIVGQLSVMLAAWDSHNKAMFIAQRAAAISQALIATFTGIAQALTWGWPLGPIFAAIIGGIGFAQVAAIAATSFGGGGGGGKGGGGGGGGGSRGLVSAAAAPPAPAQQAGEQNRLEATITLDTNRKLFTREDIEQIFDGFNELLGDNAVLKIR